MKVKKEEDIRKKKIFRLHRWCHGSKLRPSSLYETVQAKDLLLSPSNLSMLTPLFHPSSDLSDYVQDEASDSGGDVSDPGEGTSTPHHVQEGASAREHPSKQRANDVKDVWDHEPLSNQYDRAVDVAPRLLGCGWQGCQSKLASLMLLEKASLRVPGGERWTTNPAPGVFSTCEKSISK